MLGHNVRVNVEADSLNAAVLGPDVDPSSDTFNLFVSDVVRDITQKTGQKCTAIRRVYVPKERVQTVVDAVLERLAQTKVGNPAVEGVTMGPVATAQQLRDVREGIGKLASSAARIATGGAGAIDGVGAPSGKGYFVAPTLLVSDAPSASDAVHNHEVFGPCATVMPFEARRGRRPSRVRGGRGPRVEHLLRRPRLIADAVLGAAPSLGRVTVGSAKIAGQAVPPGTVMPSLIHGGPGERAAARS